MSKSNTTFFRANVFWDAVSNTLAEKWVLAYLTEVLFHERFTLSKAADLQETSQILCVWETQPVPVHAAGELVASVNMSWEVLSKNDFFFSTIGGGLKIVAQLINMYI